MSKLSDFVAGLTKNELVQLSSVVKQRMEEMSSKKLEAIRMLRDKHSSGEPLEFYGQVVYVVRGVRQCSFFLEEYVFTLSNGSEIRFKMEAGEQV